MSLTSHHPAVAKVQEPEKTRQFDRAMIFIGLISPLMAIPQAFNIWASRSAGQVSIISWATYLAINFFWLYYAYIHKSKPLLISTICWIIIEAIIVVGILVY
jgi:uncharacterized protein with PQ loop repeat